MRSGGTFTRLSTSRLVASETAMIRLARFRPRSKRKRRICIRKLERSSDLNAVGRHVHAALDIAFGGVGNRDDPAGAFQAAFEAETPHLHPETGALLRSECGRAARSRGSRHRVWWRRKPR